MAKEVKVREVKYGEEYVEYYTRKLVRTVAKRNPRFFIQLAKCKTIDGDGKVSVKLDIWDFLSKKLLKEVRNQVWFYPYFFSYFGDQLALEPEQQKKAEEVFPKYISRFLFYPHLLTPEDAVKVITGKDIILFNLSSNCLKIIRNKLLKDVSPEIDSSRQYVEQRCSLLWEVLVKLFGVEKDVYTIGFYFSITSDNLYPDLKQTYYYIEIDGANKESKMAAEDSSDPFLKFMSKLKDNHQHYVIVYSLILFYLWAKRRKEKNKIIERIMAYMICYCYLSDIKDKAELDDFLSLFPELDREKNLLDDVCELKRGRKAKFRNLLRVYGDDKDKVYIKLLEDCCPKTTTKIIKMILERRDFYCAK